MEKPATSDSSLDPDNLCNKQYIITIYTHSNLFFRSSELHGKMLPTRIIENNEIDAYVGLVNLSFTLSLYHSTFFSIFTFINPTSLGL